MKEGIGKACLRYHFCSIPEIATTTSIGFCQKILNKTHADVVAHLVELLIDLSIIIFIIGTKLSHDSAVCESNQFSIDFIDPCPRLL